MKKIRLQMVLGNVARGAAIGAANTVPGVSGGTIAVVTGIYDRLIHAAGNIFTRNWKNHLSFLFPVLVGIFLGIVGFAWVIEFGLDRAPEQTFFFFIGLIGGSVPFVYGQVRGEPARPMDIAIGLIALGVLVVQALYGNRPIGDAVTAVTITTVLPLMGAGVIASATMIIPGVSGSFVLLIIGMYSTFLQAVRQVNFPVLAVLIVGAVIGLVSVSKGMSLLLSRYPRQTYWCILGLVAGSIVGIWPGVSSVSAALGDLVMAAVGAFLAVALGKKKEQDTV
ncbi:MAG: DUF368 domain-containing protein [Alkalispirochaeta sp.]